MNRKSQFNTIIVMIMGIILIMGFITIFAPKLTESEAIQSLLGLGKLVNLTSPEFVFDRYEDELAYTSFNALKWSTNMLSLYYYDNYINKKEVNGKRQWEHVYTDEEFNKKNEWYKEFSAKDEKDRIVIKELQYDRETETLNKPTKKDVAIQIAKRVLECQDLFNKKQDNTRCFSLKLDELGPAIGLIDGNDVERAFLDIYGGKTKFQCNDSCKSKIADIIGHEPDTPWWNLYGHAKNALNLKNWEWDSGLKFSRNRIDAKVLKSPAKFIALEGDADDIDKQKSELTSEQIEKYEGNFPLVRVCGDDKLVDEVHITIKQEGDDGDDYCTVPKDGLMYGLKVRNFHMPQQVQKPGNPLGYTVGAWLGTFGDPEYLAYYEKFPAGEETHWEPNALKSGIAIGLIIEFAFAAVDAIPVVGWFFKLGGGAIKKSVMFVGKKIGKLMGPLLEGGFKNVFKIGYEGLSAVWKALNRVMDAIIGVKDAIVNAVKYPFRKAAAIALRGQVAEKFIEKNAKGLVEQTMKDIAGKKGAGKISKEAYGKLAERYSKIIAEVTAGLEKEAFTTSGKFSDKALAQISKKFDTVFDKVILEGFDEASAGALTMAVKANDDDVLRSLLADNTMDRAYKQIDDFGWDGIAESASGLSMSELQSLSKRAGFQYNEHWLGVAKEQLRGRINKQKIMQSVDIKQVKSAVTDQLKLADEFAEAVGKDNMETFAKRSSTRVLLAAKDSTFNTPTRAMVRAYKQATNTVSKMRNVLGKEMSKGEREEAVEGLLRRGLEQLEHMDKKELKKLMRSKEDVVKMIWSKKNKDILWDAGGEMPDIAKKEFTKNLDEALWKKSSTLHKIGKTLGGFVYRGDGKVKRRHLFAVTAATVVALEESINEKQYTAGRNTMVMKMPYVTPFVAREMENYNEVKNDDENSVFNFFKNYGDQSHAPYIHGMLPREFVNPFYVQLIKDKGFSILGWHPVAQYPEKFFLASPCHADLVVSVSRCKCHNSPTEEVKYDNPIINLMLGNDAIFESGKYNPRLKETVDFDPYRTDDNQLYTVEMTYGQKPTVVKQCHSKSIWRSIWLKDNTYKPICINVNPVVESYKVEGDNYCYRGVTSPQMWFADKYLNYWNPLVGGIAAGALCAASVAGAPVSPICYSLGSLATGLVPALVYAGLEYHFTTAWPAHS